MQDIGDEQRECRFALPLYVWQILLIELPGRFGVIVLSALHPVNAGIMLGLAIVLAHRAWKAIRAKAGRNSPR